MMFRNARLRLTAWYAGSITVVLLILGVAAYVVLRGEIDGEIDGSLESTLIDLAPRLEPAGPPSQRRDDQVSDAFDRVRNPRQGPAPVVPTDVFTLILALDGSVVFNGRNLEVGEWPLAALAAESTSAARWDEFSSGGTRYRLRSVVIDHGREAAQILAVGRSLAARDRQLDVLLWVLGAGGLGGVVLASAGGYLLAGHTLNPIRKALDTQRRFVSDASHELRTPIAVVTANTDVLLGHSEESIEDNIDHVAAISDEAGHMAKLVNDLLTLARADEGRLNLELGPVDGAGLVNGLVDAMSVIAIDRGITLRGQAGPTPLEADPVRLRQVLAILMDNALKYTPPGGSVTVSCVRRGSFVDLNVADTGAGIPAPDQSRIFDRFYRVDAARTAGGAGLGLAIARTITEAHGGRLTVESTPGKGSTFTARLPAKQ